MKVLTVSINVQQEEVRITKTLVETQCKKIPNWKAPGPDGVQGYWLKKITSCHERNAEELHQWSQTQLTWGPLEVESG